MINRNDSLKVLLLLIGLVALLFLVGCGGSDDAAAPEAAEGSSGEAAESPVADVPEIEGERYETETASMIIPDGWNVMDIDGGFQAYKGNYAVEVWVRGSGLSDDDARSAIENFINNYDGTERVEIGITGSDHLEDDEIIGMLDSVIIK